MAFAWPVAKRRRVGAIMTLNSGGLLIEIHVQDSLSIKDHVNQGAFAGNLVRVPLGGFLDLFTRRNSSIKAAGQLGILRLWIVAEVGHLQVQAV